jgi:hypothetical protein
VVRTDRIATRHIDRQGHRIAHLDCAAFNLAAMGVQSAKRLCGVVNGDGQTVSAGNRTGIAHLTTRFAIKRRLVRDDRHGIARAGAFDFLAILDDGHDLRFAGGAGVTGKFGRADAFGNIEPDFPAAASPLPFHAARAAAFCCAIAASKPSLSTLIRANAAHPRSIIREAVGVIELEGRFTGQRTAFAQTIGGFVEQLEPLSSVWRNLVSSRSSTS